MRPAHPTLCARSERFFYSPKRNRCGLRLRGGPMRQFPLCSAILLTLSFFMIAGVTPAYSQFNVLYNFGTGGTSDPCQPLNSGIIAQGQDGNLYTTAPSCGTNDGGSAFQVTPAGAFHLIYIF